MKDISCNCQKKLKPECPIPGSCNQDNVIYQAEITTENKVMKYYGSTENFKDRYSSHKSAIYGENPPTNPTTLSSYIWKLRDNNENFNIKWSIKEKGHPFSSGGRACDLCVTEKLVIMTSDKNSMLNKRDEILEKCRHRRKHLLVSVNEKVDKG